MKLHLITVLPAAVFLTACRPQASKSEVVPIDTPSVVRPVPADTLPKPDTARIYTYKELEEINDELLRRWEATRHTPAGRNCAGFGIGASTIHIRLMVNTPEWQSRFRREVMDSPAFTFEGDAVLPELAATAPPSSGDVYLLPEREAWPDTVRQVRFLLCNASENRVTYGLGSDVAFRDAGGTWRRMPTNYAIADILCMLDTDAVTTFSQTLYPDVCPLGPGTHRYFHEVYIDGKRTTLMAEFRLTDAASTPAATELTPIPEAVLQGRGEDEWRRQVQAQQDADRTGEVHVMPAFPGGDEALAAWLRAHPVTHDGPPGNVTVRMTVRTDGSLSDVFIARPLHTVADSLARRVMEQMPRWHAALRDGLPVRWQASVVVPVGSMSQADTFKR